MRRGSVACGRSVAARVALVRAAYSDPAASSAGAALT